MTRGDLKILFQNHHVVSKPPMLFQNHHVVSKPPCCFKTTMFFQNHPVVLKPPSNQPSFLKTLHFSNYCCVDLEVESVAEVVRHGRLRWFGHVERKNGDDWVSAFRNVVVTGVRCAGRGRKTWRECVKDDMNELGLHSEWVVFRDMWRSLMSGKTSDPSWAWKKWTF